MVDLPWAADAGVDDLERLPVSLQRVRVEQVSPFGRERQSTVALAELDQRHEALLKEVPQRVMRKIEIVFGDDPECTDSGQRSAVCAVTLVDSIAASNKLALVAARQVEIAHQGFPRIVLITVVWVVHVRPFVAAISRLVLPRIEGDGPAADKSLLGSLIRRR